MVGLGRVELPTYGLGNRRSIHLSYSPFPKLYTEFGRSLYITLLFQREFDGHASKPKNRKTVDLAKTDWRDLLVAANFLTLNSHESWLLENTW
jgi:hypothetical protein